MKKLLIILCMALVSCGVFGQTVKVKDINGTFWQLEKHVDLPDPTPYSVWSKKHKQGIVYAQFKHDGFYLTREIALGRIIKQDTLDFWVLTKKDSSNIKSIRILIPSTFGIVEKKLLNELVFAWYRNYKIKDDNIEDVIIHTINELGDSIRELSK